MSQSTLIDKDQTEAVTQQLSGKYLTFQLDGTDFGISIMKVVELLKIVKITKVPTWPTYALGTINLRGKVISVVDLRLKFGLEAIPFTDKTCIVVMEFGNDQVGVVVESVEEVRNFLDQDISEPPIINNSVQSDFILGIGKADDNTTILLNMDDVLGGEEQALLEIAKTGNLSDSDL